VKNYFRLGRKTFFFFDDTKVDEVKKAFEAASRHPLTINRTFLPTLYRPVPFLGPWHLNIVGFISPDECTAEELAERNEAIQKAFLRRVAREAA